MPGVRIVCMLVGQRLLESATTAVGKEGGNRIQGFRDGYLKFCRLETFTEFTVSAEKSCT